VATGFPAGQTHLKTRLEEIRLAVEDGAKEIDVVINRTLVLTGQWEGGCMGQHLPGELGGDLVRGSLV
jgi:deoxyribose-phosphate aldolase